MAGKTSSYGLIGTLLGAAIGTAIAPGLGTYAGASLGGSLGGTYGASEDVKDTEKSQRKEIAAADFQRQIVEQGARSQRLATLSPARRFGENKTQPGLIGSSIAANVTGSTTSGTF